MSQKNIGLSMAATHLGLGQELITQVENEAELRKKKVREMENMAKLTGAAGALLGSPGNVGDGNG